MMFQFVTTSFMFALLGVCVGSFLNVVAYRLPLGMSLANPPSHCTSCNHKLSWLDNIPLFSYLFLRGRCRYCHQKYSSRYFWVELLNGLLWLCCAFRFWQNLFWCSVASLALSVLLTMTLCDFDNLFIPDSLQVALAVVAVLGAFADPSVGIVDRLWGLLGTSAFFVAFYQLAFVMFGREGMGFADVKLMSLLGFLLGWKGAVVAVIVGVFVALVDIARQSFTVTRNSFSKPEYPFAPYLAMGGAVALFFTNDIVGWYLAMFF